MTNRCLIVVRNLVTGSDGEIYPRTPVSSSIQKQANGWFSFYPDASNKDVFLSAWRIHSGSIPIEQNGRGAFVTFGSVGVLRALRDSSVTSYTVEEIRTPIDATSTFLKAQWQTVSGSVELGGTMFGWDIPATMETTTGSAGDV